MDMLSGFGDSRFDADETRGALGQAPPANLRESSSSSPSVSVAL
ncbi:uncharacterized protein J3R85_019805 [Psidium guajava]|nr:uncharacterized protein J3R85_019805 [Psidium guajava]